MKRNILWILLAVILSVGCAIYFPNVSKASSLDLNILPQDIGDETALLAQEKVSVLQHPTQITKIYVKNQLIGVINDMQSLEDILHEVYVKDYEDKFPGTEVGLGEDVYCVTEQSYFEYENIDKKIQQYLVDC